MLAKTSLLYFFVRIMSNKNAAVMLSCLQNDCCSSNILQKIYFFYCSWVLHYASFLHGALCSFTHCKWRHLHL